MSSGITTGRNPAHSSSGLRGTTLGMLGGASALGYLTATLGFQSSTSPNDLSRMVVLFCGLAVIWAFALWQAARATPRFGVVVGFALVFRLLLLPAGYSFQEVGYQRFLLFDDHVWRYLWEGHVWSAGVDPWSTPPAALDEYVIDTEEERLSETLYSSSIWSEVFERVNSPEVASPYPIVAHALFRFAHACAPASVLFWKLLMLGFDMGTILLIGRLARLHSLGVLPLLAYGWNPLVIKEFAGSGHVDAALVFFLVLAVSVPQRLGSLSLGVAALIKPVAFLLTPALFRRGGWKALVAPVSAAIALYGFFPQGLRVVALDWTVNPVFHRVFPIPRTAWLMIAALILSCVAVYGFRKDDGTPRSLWEQAVLLLGTMLLLSPAFAPWYLTWLIPFAALTQSTLWLAFSGSIFLSYLSAFDLPAIPLLVLLQFAFPVLVWWWKQSNATRMTPMEDVEVGKVLSLSSVVGVAGGLCCLSPIVMVLLGLSNLTFAATVGDLFYGEYRWLFRLASLMLGGMALWRYFRARGVCTIDDARRQRTWIINVAVLTLFSSVTVYVLFTYIVLQEWGIRVGLPWAQYDESWAIPVSITMVAIVAVMTLALRTRVHGRHARASEAEAPAATHGTP